MEVEIKNELKERMEKGLQEMQKGQEELRNTLEKKIDSVEEKIALKVEEKIAVVEEKIEKKVGEEIGKITTSTEKFWGRIHLAISLIGRRSPLSLENKVILYKQILRPVLTYGSPVWGAAAAATHMKKTQQVEEIEIIKEQIEERIEEVAGNFTQRVEDLEKKLLACGNTKNESKFVPVSLVPMPAFPVLLTASPVSVKLSTYDGKTNWEVYNAQFSIISEANGWTGGVKASQLAVSLRAAEILQTLPDTERLNLSSQYNALDLRFGQKYSKDYARLQMKTRLQKTGESLQNMPPK
ncbi:uncharacterized protein TNCV_4263051 [Trichonephila clavipes]|nr:uncharacterized protein TNCV_4263051 [Trichonephila clavipes]